MSLEGRHWQQRKDVWRCNSSICGQREHQQQGVCVLQMCYRLCCSCLRDACRRCSKNSSSRVG